MARVFLLLADHLMTRLERLLRPAASVFATGERPTVRQARGLALFANIRVVYIKR
jgi:hypothetical protein